MSELAVADIKSRLPMPQGIDDMDARKWRVLCESVFPSAKTAESIVMAIDYCRTRKLDVFKRPVNIVPMWNKSLGKEVETIWPGINEVQTTAARTGQYAGMDEPKWGDLVTREFAGIAKWKDGSTWKEENLKVVLTFPESCSVTVYRMIGGQRCPFTEPVFWEEAYAKRGKTEVPNDMWAKRPRGQLLKVAKAFSLRAAFPEEGEYVAEEMEGKEIDNGGIVIDNTNSGLPYEVDQSKPKSPFKNNPLRTQYQNNVTESFKEAVDIKTLDTIVELNAARFKELEASGDERDQMTLNELRNRYSVRKQSLQQRTEEPEKVDDYPVDEAMEHMRDL